MKKILLLISASVFFWSCTEDVSKEIITDLSQEANQFFRFSEALNESAYLGNISLAEYFRIFSEELPGCPEIILSPGSRIIQLNYSGSQECQQQNKTPRTGKIILDFTLSNTSNPSWSMTYENYFFGKTLIDGVRYFVNPSFNENRETFENLRVELEKNLGFAASGNLSYSVARLGSRPFALSTRGRIEGRNPAGRDFSLVITEAKEQSFSCYRDGWELPQRGKENWIVSRSASSSLDYRVRFEQGTNCNPVVISTLPDGRSLQLNP
jgi:hypothetical protein